MFKRITDRPYTWQFDSSPSHLASARSAVGETGLALGALDTVGLDVGALDSGGAEVLLGLSGGVGSQEESVSA